MFQYINKYENSRHCVLFITTLQGYSVNINVKCLDNVQHPPRATITSATVCLSQMSILICMCIWKYRVSRCNFRTNTNHSFIPWHNIEITDCPLSHRRPYPDGHTRPTVCSVCLPTCDDARAHLRCVCQLDRRTYATDVCESIFRFTIACRLLLARFFVFHVETRPVYRRL